MWLFDEETLRFLDVNRAAVDVYGYSRDDFLEMDILAICPGEDAPRVVDHIRGGGGLRGEWRHRTKRGDLIDVEVIASRVTVDGRPARVVIARDVSHKVALESQLHAQKIETIGQLAGGIAHDFNNLLAAIVGHVEVLSDYLAPGDPRTAEVAAIREAADLAADLTRQLLAFSRKQQLRPTVLNLNDVIDRMRAVLQRLVRESIVLETRPADHLWSVRADAGQVEQIILNLVVNARDAMPSGGGLTIETANVTISADVARRRSVDKGDYVQLLVSDTGTGISPEARVRLFEPFFTTKDRHRGTGLGLATVYGIVKQSGGHIIVDSEIGHGSTFAIYLPATAASVDSSLPERRVHTGGGSETVLVVEHDHTVRALIGDVLRRRGYQLLVAQDGPDALRVAEEHGSPIHLLITSLTATAATGAAVADAMRARRPDTRVLFLQKPFTPGGLARKVRAVLEIA